MYGCVCKPDTRKWAIINSLCAAVWVERQKFLIHFSYHALCCGYFLGGNKFTCKQEQGQTRTCSAAFVLFNVVDVIQQNVIHYCRGSQAPLLLHYWENKQHVHRESLKGKNMSLLGKTSVMTFTKHQQAGLELWTFCSGKFPQKYEQP